MRIVLVTHFYPAHGGGVEQVAARLAERMAALGVEVVWFASDTDAPPPLAGVRCEPMRTCNAVERLSGFPYPLWSPASLARLARSVRAADGVHVHDCIYAGSLAAAWLARRHRKRLVVTQHIGVVPLPRPLRPLLALANRLGARVVLRRAAGVGFISPVVRQYFEGLVNAATAFHYVPNGVDGDIFHPAQPDAPERRAQQGLDPARPLLLFVGRFVPKKRLPIVREMAVLRPQWQWCVIGHGPEQPQQWGLANVRVLPAMGQPQLAEWYRAADLLVLPSEGEGFPLVVQEAMACGLPACVTAAVAAGATLPDDLWLELPDAGQGTVETARRGVACIERWLADREARARQRAAVAAYAAENWRWDVAARAHLRWLQEGAC